MPNFNSRKVKMKYLFWLIFTFTWTITNAQDTLQRNQLIDVTGTREGQFIIEGAPRTTLRDDRYVIMKASYYTVGNYKAGQRHGQWKNYKKGAKVDTLTTQYTYINDTLQSDSSFYKNGSIKSTSKFINGKLVNEISFFTTGNKKYEAACINCDNFYSNSDIISCSYYMNGTLKEVGRFKRFTKNKNGETVCCFVREKGKWYYYTDKAEILKIETYWLGLKIKTKKFETQGKFLEWTEEEEILKNQSDN